jgi:hypothetical protein
VLRICCKITPNWGAFQAIGSSSSTRSYSPAEIAANPAANRWQRFKQFKARFFTQLRLKILFSKEDRHSIMYLGDKLIGHRHALHSGKGARLQHPSWASKFELIACQTIERFISAAPPH